MDTKCQDLFDSLSLSWEYLSLYKNHSRNRKIKNQKSKANENEENILIPQKQKTKIFREKSHKVHETFFLDK